MSDRPSDLDFKLQHVVVAVSDVAEWFDLGLQLGLPSATLRLIATDPNIKDIKSQRLAMLSEWLKYDAAASWEKLAAALTTIGENVVAANVRSLFMKANQAQAPSTMVPDISEDEKTCQEMKQNVLRTIKCRFAALLLEVRSAMEARHVKLNDVHQFFLTSFQGEYCVPEAPDLTKLFNIITEAKLWRYDQYSPLRELTETFLPDNNPARKLVDEYKNQLSGFYVTTKIVDFIDLSELDDSDEDSEDDTQQSLSPEESKKLYHELKVTLKLDRTIKLSDMTMNYVNKLWKALIKEFNLPPLMAIIKKIISGSLIIMWLVPPQVSTVIAASCSKYLKFYQQHNIVKVQLDGRTVYDEEWIGDDSDTALIEACDNGHFEAVMVLLDNGANVNYQNWYGQSALWYASSTECVKVLVEYGAQVDLPDENGSTALIRACQHGCVEMATILLEHGANVDHQNKDEETALILASYWGKTETTSLLLKAGAKTDIQEKSGQTALYRAAVRGYVNIVQILIDYGTAVDIRDKDGETALFWATFNGHVEVVKLLVKYGAQVDIQNRHGWTGLMKASSNGHSNTVMALLEAKADPDITDESGMTALHKAAREGHVEVIKMLVKYGAAVNIKNKYGQTALDVASNGGEKAVYEVLEQYTNADESQVQWPRRDIFIVNFTIFNYSEF